MKQFSSMLHPRNKLSRPGVVAVASLSAIVGVMVILLVSASSTPIAFEAESGTVAGTAVKVVSSSASGGSAVQFLAAVTSTPVPTPTPTPTSTSVSGGGAFCSSFPALPSTKPTASNTGVPAGTILTASGSINVTTAGTVINAKDVDGDITVSANNVTIQNSKVHSAGGANTKGIIISSGTGTKIINSEIYTTNGGYIGIDASDTTVCGSYLHGWENSLTVGGGMMIQANFIEKSVAGQAGAHNDGIEIYYSGAPSKLWGNNIMLTNASGGWLDETGAINLTAGAGNIDNVEMNGNWVGGGSYTVYVDEQNGDNATNIKITNNVWYGTAPAGHATWGPALIRDQSSVTTWSGNTWENGTTIAK